MDGLLSSVGLVSCVALAGMAILTGQWAAAGVACALAGALCGFLWYNAPPASIFLGDGGSMLIGLLLGVLALRCPAASLEPSSAAS
jgi:UDP-GlcNAc:undecaprenyl-phosphate GlcNAc-1-phosphate transferase